MDCLPIGVGSRLRTAIRLPLFEEGFLQGIDCRHVTGLYRL
jgi:hypothetical protein